MSVKHILVSGSVQGVSFRYFTKQTAQELMIRGWVRNLADGRVEALIKGEPKDVDLFLEWIKKGPTLAKVSDVVVTELTDEQIKDDLRYPKFVIKENSPESYRT
jgi:acylphosphatase